MLHRFRSAMGTCGQDKLRGTVEGDETFIGGEHAGPSGRGALGKELVIVAGRVAGPQGLRAGTAGRHPRREHAGAARLPISPTSSQA
jgi:hypothetical protein